MLVDTIVKVDHSVTSEEKISMMIQGKTAKAKLPFFSCPGDL